MKKKILIISVFTLILLLLIKLNVFAVEILTLKTLTDKEIYSVNDAVTVTIDWNEGMQAAGFNLKYDESKLKFESADIKDTFYNSNTDGLIKVNWASMEEIDYTKMLFKFKAIADGTATISITKADAFADGNLVSPNSYDITTFGSKQITINKLTSTEENDDNKKEETQDKEDEQAKELTKAEALKIGNELFKKQADIILKLYSRDYYYDGNVVAIPSTLKDELYSLLTDNAINQFEEKCKYKKEDNKYYYDTLWLGTISIFGAEDVGKTELVVQTITEDTISFNLNKYNRIDGPGVEERIAYSYYEGFVIKNINGTWKIQSIVEKSFKEHPVQNQDDYNDKKDETTNNKNNVIKDDDTLANGTIPQTGISTFVVFTIMLLAVVGVIGFIKYKKLSDI